MSDPWHELRLACERWEELTEAETAGILHEDWPKIEAAQAAKRRLQADFTRLSQDCRSDAGGRGSEWWARQARQRAAIARLVRGEQRNQALVREHQAKIRVRLADSEVAARSLGRVRQAYAPRRGSAWHTYL